nr:phage tail domain-containing protein [Brachybacterium subflavum]
MVILGRGPQDYPTLHLHGSEGLGIPPVDISKTDRLTSHGSIVRGVRYTDREVFLPIFVDCADMFELNALRQQWYDLVAPDKGPVEIRVEIPQGDDTDPITRSIFGYYKSGLEGDFGDDYYGDAQKIGLTFDCPDPLWLGPERLRTLQINPGSKPFLSDYQFTRKNLAVNPSFESGLAQGASPTGWAVNATGGVDTAWAGAGTQSVRAEAVSGGTNNTAFYPWGTPDKSDMAAVYGMTSGKTFTVGATIHLGAAQTGTIIDHARRIGINTYANGSASYNVFQSDAAPNAAGTYRLKVTFTVPAGNPLVSVRLSNGSNTVPVWWDQITVEEGTTDGTYFDGDSTGGAWTGTPHASVSGLVVPGTGVPFFPVVLAESFAQGKWTVAIDGDSDVWPTWEITGPGSDLIIQRGSERIFIQGQFTAGSVTRIQTAPDRMRITPDRWNDLSLDSDQFPLKPGSNDIAVSLANATTDTTIRLVWRETYRGAI